MPPPFPSESEHFPARPASAGWRTAVAAGGVFILLTAIAAAFWYQDLRYSLPTPRPPQLVEPARDQRIPFPPILAAALPDAGAQPIFLHFFNADCPCSRFNLDHIVELAREHGDAAKFIAIVQTSGEPEAMAKLKERVAKSLGGMATLIDREGAVATACGVYSTPQAVLLSADHRLLFRGNYNVSRYCGDRATQFARLALESELAQQRTPAMPAAATLAYGCELPVFAGPSPALFR